MVRRERHGGCAGGGAGLLRGPGEEARLVLLVDTRPPRRVHALRPSFALLEVGEPVPLFTDRFLGIYLPLGLVRGVLVGAAVAGGQARGAEVVGVARPVLEQLRGAGHRAAGAASGHTRSRSPSSSRASQGWTARWS